MSILKVIEVLAESDKSWEDAAQNATVENGKITKYRINGKISFLLEGQYAG